MGAGSQEHEHAGAELEPLEASQAPARRQPAYAAAGNRAFGEFVGRMGAGLMPGGAVHPEVASAIGAARGSGHTLPESVRAEVGGQLGDSLEDVRIHTDGHAADLSKSVAARAFTTGTDVFFGAGEYQPSSRDGKALIAHELTHVTQQRGAPTGGPMTVSEPGDAVEVEAEQVAHDVAG